MAYSILRRVFQRSTGVFKSRSISSKSGSKEEAPWLMLLPSFEGHSMYYNFYSLTEEKVISIKKSFQSEAPAPDDDAEFVGSSHGWLALLNRRNGNLFLSNPRSGRHIKLPWIYFSDYLLNSELYTRNGRVIVGKVILSSSPDEQGCCAAMIYGPGNWLAVCTPGVSEYFSQIRDPFKKYIFEPRHRKARVCEDVVFCSRRKILNCITPFELDLVSFHNRNYDCDIEYWDVGGETVKPHSDFSSLIIDRPKAIGRKTRRWVEENYDLLENLCVQIPHLVYAEECLYVVVRFVALLGTDGTYVDPLPQCSASGLRGYFPCKSVGFLVAKVDYDKYCFEIVDDLNGLALFVGINHSFAVSAAAAAGLVPNSIYFTDAKRLSSMDGRDDTGIFDYEKKTISNILVQGNPIQSSLGWFKP